MAACRRLRTRVPVQVGSAGMPLTSHQFGYDLGLGITELSWLSHKCPKIFLPGLGVLCAELVQILEWEK